MAEIISLSTKKPKECIDITQDVAEIVRRSGVRRGLCHVMSLHTTASVTLNESADPNIGVDLLTALERAVPKRANWLHDRIDDNAQSHILGSLVGPSETVPIEEGSLLLGTWQTILLVELDGPRSNRRIAVQILPIG